MKIGFFPDPFGHYDFMTLQRKTDMKTSRLEQLLWRQVWTGKVSNDSFHPVRKGAANQSAAGRGGEDINGEKSTKSPYLGALKVQFDLLQEPNRVTLYKKRT